MAGVPEIDSSRCLWEATRAYRHCAHQFRLAPLGGRVSRECAAHTGTLHAVGQTDQGHEADGPVGRVDLPPPQAVAGRRLGGMVIVVPALAEGEQRHPPQVRRGVAGRKAAVAPDVGSRVYQPGRVQHQARSHEAAPDEPRQAARGVERGEHQQGEDEVETVERAVDRVAGEVGCPLREIFRIVSARDIGRHPPEHVGPGEAAAGAMHVLLVVGMRVVLAVVGDPANRATLGGAAADGREEVFEPAGPEGEAAVGEEPVVRQADAQAGGEPVEGQADRRGRPGEIGGHEREEGPHVQSGNPEHGGPRDPGRSGPRLLGLSHEGLVIPKGPSSIASSHRDRQKTLVAPCRRTARLRAMDGPDPSPWRASQPRHLTGLSDRAIDSRQLKYRGSLIQFNE